MSFNNEDPKKSATRHKPAILAIIVALIVAVLVFFAFTPGVDEQNEGIATTAPPGDTPISDAEGLGEDVAPTVSPGADTPADGTTGPVGSADQPADEITPAN